MYHRGKQRTPEGLLLRSLIPGLIKHFDQISALSKHGKETLILHHFCHISHQSLWWIDPFVHLPMGRQDLYNSDFNRNGLNPLHIFCEQLLKFVITTN